MTLPELPNSVKTIINTLKTNGYDAYAVGGCVRDSLLGIPPHDYDICTSAKPNETKRCFPDNTVVETGLQHGTITVVIDHEPFEITTFRIDGDYTDGRHPDSVIFTRDITRDLARRDFTINAMALDGTHIIDPFGGRTDLANRIIRCVGNPDDRFTEDALRILRALRFAANYDFTIDPHTADAIHRHKYALNQISKERIRSELVRLLIGKHVFNILHDFSDVISVIIPEIAPTIGFRQNNPYHCYDVYDHTMHAVENYQGSDIAVKVALLLHDIGKPSCYTENETGGHFYGHAAVSHDMAEPILDRLRFDTKTKTEVLSLIAFHDTKLEPTLRSVKRHMNRIGQDTFLRFLEVRHADVMAHSLKAQPYNLEKLEKVGEICKQIEEENACFKLKDLAIQGRDLLKLGYKEGPEIGRTLKQLLDAVIDGNVTNTKSELELIAKEKLSHEPE
jgi:tRNA nucleotidyltransferase (CCA-adding enzyme)